MDDERVPEEHASEEAGSGGADSPEEAVGEVPDQDAGPTKTAEQVESDEERDQAEGEPGQAS
jgi:hypothetical protein